MYFTMCANNKKNQIKSPGFNILYKKYLYVMSISIVLLCPLTLAQIC